IEGLDKINQDKLSSKAKKARIYIESQVQKTKTTLDSVENKLMDFQRTNKAVSLPEQVNAAIDAAAKLKAEIMKTEVELGLLEPNLRKDNKSLLALKNKLNNLQEQYTKMEMGSQDYLVAFKEVPELGKVLANLLREVKIQNEVYTMLQQQYYKEKIQENKDLPTVEILDEAIPPLSSSSPRIVFATVMGGIFVFLCASLIFIVKDRQIYLLKNKNNKKEENV
ncbi:MAG: GNVR domain-containing protein, partial [Ignavibacteriaceae bacterium]